ncbi:MAG: type II toxin-antitoxin system VapC family toxin [Gordonia sp. (in: high G+C Gram-positive bacteria)]
MNVIYLDTSAAAKLILEEPESAGVADALTAHTDDGGELISSALLHTELSRVAFRAGVPQHHVDMLTDMINLVAVTQPILERAAAFRIHIRTLDAIHLASAQALTSLRPAVLTFDKQMRTAAQALKLPIAQYTAGPAGRPGVIMTIGT